MKPQRKVAACAVLCALALAGCAENPLKGRQASLTDTSPGINTSKITPEGEADFLLAYQYVRGANVTQNMPNRGTASFVGGLGADVSGDVDGYVTGAIDVRVTNLNNGLVAGTISDMAVYDVTGEKTQDLNGGLVVTGNVSGNTIDTSAAGVVTKGLQTSTVSLDLDGTFRSLDGRASAATGTVTGGGTGGFDFTLDDGKFYLVED